MGGDAWNCAKPAKSGIDSGIWVKLCPAIRSELRAAIRIELCPASERIEQLGQVRLVSSVAVEFGHVGSPSVIRWMGVEGRSATSVYSRRHDRRETMPGVARGIGAKGAPKGASVTDALGRVRMAQSGRKPIDPSMYSAPHVQPAVAPG